MSKQIRVNVLSMANTEQASVIKHNGRDVMVVPSVTLPDNIVMNDIMYPAEEIAASFETLNNTPAPFGHPSIDGMFVSASHPEGINRTYVGAWNANARRKDGRVFIEKYIDIEVANRSPEGKALLEAINKKEPIHTSTGLYCNIEDAPADSGYKYVARNLYFDHDAILLNEEGAATPNEGVGIFVNALGRSGDKVDVVNSAIDWAEEELDWSGVRLIESMERLKKASVWEKVKAIIFEAIGFDETEQNQAKGDTDMSDNTELANAIAKLTETVAGMQEGIANAIKEELKPVVEQVNAQKAALEAAETSKKAELVNKVVAANVMTKDAAEATPIAALEQLAEAVAPKGAAMINGKFRQPKTDEFEGYDINGHFDA